MYSRLLGCDADVTFAPLLADAVAAAEARFPAPAHAVVFADADPSMEDDVDQLIVCRRVGGVLMPMVFVGLDELAAWAEDGTDWLGAIEADLARTETDIAEIVAGESAER